EGGAVLVEVRILGGRALARFLPRVRARRRGRRAASARRPVPRSECARGCGPACALTGVAARTRVEVVRVRDRHRLRGLERIALPAGGEPVGELAGLVLEVDE